MPRAHDAIGIAIGLDDVVVDVAGGLDDVEGAIAGGEPAEGAAGGVAVEGVIGAAGGGEFCAQPGEAIARAAAMATLVNRYFMIGSFVAVPDSRHYGDGVLYPRADFTNLRWETTRPLFRSDECATVRIAYPTPPAADIITHWN